MTYNDLVPAKSCQCGANSLNRSILHHDDRDLQGSAIKKKHRPMFPGPLQVPPSDNQRARSKHNEEGGDEGERSSQDDGIMGRSSSERMSATFNDSAFRRPSSSSSTATTRPYVPPSATYTWPMPRPLMESTLQPPPHVISTTPRSASASRLPSMRLSPYDIASDYDTESVSSYSVSPMNSEARLPYPSSSRAMTQLDSASMLVRPLEAIRIVRSTSADEARFLENQQREVNGPIRFSNSVGGRSTQRHAPYPSPSPPPSSKSSECDRSSTTSFDQNYAVNPSDIEGGASSSSAASTRPWDDFAHGIMDETGALKWKCTWLHNDKPCGYTAKKQLVKRHIECTHLKIKSFVCQECGSAFPQKSAYNTHMYGHQNLKPLACPYNCGEYFRDPARRHRHMKDEHGYVPRMSKKKFKPDVL